VSGCSGSINYAEVAQMARLAPPPAHLLKCGGLTKIPKKSLEDHKEIRRLVKSLRGSELRHSRCREQAIAYYNAARKKLNSQ
jgi:hypothetical protein